MTTGAGYASFDRDWSPEDYLRDYYREVQPDEDVTMRFLVEAAALVGEVPALLEFGCGPTVHHLLPFAPRPAEIHLADYLPRNLDAVRTWVDGRGTAWDWSPFTELTLRHELRRAPQPWEIREREVATRERVRSFQRADARHPQPLADGTRRYAAVLCCFCPDSITADIDEWRRCTEHVASLVAPGGWFVLTALGGADRYRVGGRSFPSPRVEVDDIADVLLGAGFSRLGTSITSAVTGDADEHGFDAVLLAVSRKL
jgi:hypothetical protein